VHRARPPGTLREIGATVHRDESETVPRDKPLAGASVRLPWAALLLCFSSLVILHLMLGRDVVVPPRGGPGDQWGYLGNARSLAGSGPAWILPRFPYFSFGYSLVLVPAHALFHDPEDLYLAVRVTNALLAASVLPLLYGFCRLVLRRVRWVSFVAALSGALVPSLLAHSSLALAENLVRPLCVATVLACYVMLNARRVWPRLWFGPSVALLYATHERFLLSVAVALALIASGLLARQVPRSVAVANLGLLAGLLVAATLVRNSLVEARWVAGIDRPQGPAGDVFDVFTDLSFFGRFMLEWFGQAWYIAAGSLGIGVLGIGVLATRLQTHGTGIPMLQRWERAAASDPTWLTTAFLLVCAAGVFLISCYFFTRVDKPAEGYFYGRHNESFMPMWVAAGVAFLAGERSHQTVGRALAASGSFVVLAAAMLLVMRDEVDWNGLVSALNAPSISFYNSAGRAIVLVPTIVAVGALTLLFVMRSVGVNPVLAVPLALILVRPISTEIGADPTYSEWRSRRILPNSASTGLRSCKAAAPERPSTTNTSCPTS
jgi:hypothetical protein